MSDTEAAIVLYQAFGDAIGYFDNETALTEREALRLYDWLRKRFPHTDFEGYAKRVEAWEKAWPVPERGEAAP